MSDTEQSYKVGRAETADQFIEIGMAKGNDYLIDKVKVLQEFLTKEKINTAEGTIVMIMVMEDVICRGVHSATPEKCTCENCNLEILISIIKAMQKRFAQNYIMENGISNPEIIKQIIDTILETKETKSQETKPDDPTKH